MKSSEIEVDIVRYVSLRMLHEGLTFETRLSKMSSNKKVFNG